MNNNELKEFNTDYIIYDNERGIALTFTNGEIILYGDKQEAIDDLRRATEEIILYTKYKQKSK